MGFLEAGCFPDFPDRAFALDDDDDDEGESSSNRDTGAVLLLEGEAEGLDSVLVVLEEHPVVTSSVSILLSSTGLLDPDDPDEEQPVPSSLFSLTVKKFPIPTMKNIP